MKITEITPEVLKTLSPEIETWLKGIADKYGIGLTIGGGQFGDGWADLKLRVTLKQADGSILSKEAIQFKNFPPLGFVAEDLGREFTNAGKRYKIAGRSAGSKPRIVVARVPDGKLFTMHAQDVRAALGLDLNKERSK